MEIQREKEELIEMFGVHFESLYNFPPLASRILGNLIVDCSVGMTFETLVEKVGASKSSVSTNLNLLLKLGKINYYTIPGDRKKYFKPSPFSERLTNYQKMLEFEKAIIDRMISYREKSASCNAEICNLQNTKAYRTHVVELEQLLAKTIEEFKEIENNTTKINQNEN